MNLRRRALALLAGLLLAPVAFAQSGAWPTKPIKIIIPFPAGSGTDSSARFIGQAITAATGQPVVVDNRAGGNGFIAAQAAAQSPPDGYTLFITTMTTQSVNPHLYKSMPYDPAKDFAPVSLISKSPMILVVRNEDDQAKNMAELTAMLRKRNAKINYATGNTSSRVAAEVYGAWAHLPMVQVPYKGTPQGLTDLLGGQVDLMFPDVTPSVPLVKSGKLRALAVTGNARLSSLPEVPTAAEQGVPGLDLVTWSACFVPAATPKPVVDKLNQIMRHALESKEAVEYYARSGSLPAPTTPDELREFTRTELEAWGKAIRLAGIPQE